MTALAWILFGTTLLWMVLAFALFHASLKLATEVERQKRMFREQERAHIQEIQELVNQYPPPPGDLSP